MSENTISTVTARVLSYAYSTWHRCDCKTSVITSSEAYVKQLPEAIHLIAYIHNIHLLYSLSGMEMYFVLPNDEFSAFSDLIGLKPEFI